MAEVSRITGRWVKTSVVIILILLLATGMLLLTYCLSRSEPFTVVARTATVVFITDGMHGRVPGYDKRANTPIVDAGVNGYRFLCTSVARNASTMPYDELYAHLDLLHVFYMGYREMHSERTCEIEAVFLALLNSSDLEPVRCALTYIYYHRDLSSEAIGKRIRELASSEDEYVNRFARAWVAAADANHRIEAARH